MNREWRVSVYDYPAVSIKLHVLLLQLDVVPFFLYEMARKCCSAYMLEWVSCDHRFMKLSCFCNKQCLRKFSFFSSHSFFWEWNYAQHLFSLSFLFMTAINDAEVDYNMFLASFQRTYWTFSVSKAKESCMWTANFIYNDIIKLCLVHCSLRSLSTSGLEANGLKPWLLFASAITSKNN